MNMIDLYSLPVPLNFKGKEAFGNAVSAYLSLFTLIAAVGVVCFNFYRYFRFTDPEFVLQEQNRSDEEDVPWSRYDFDMSIGIWGLGRNNYGVAPLTQVEGLIKNQKIPLMPDGYTEPHTVNQIKRCSEIEAREGSMKERHISIGQAALMNDFCCIDFDKEFWIGGDFVDRGYEQMILGDLIFKGDKDNYPYLEDIHNFSLSYSDSLPDFREEQGFKRLFREKGFSFGFGTKYFLNIEFSLNRVESDDNIIFDFVPTKVYEFLKVESIDLLPYKQIEPDLVEIELYFNFSTIQKTYLRSNRKIDSVLADSFAVINLIFISGKLFFRLTYSNNFYLEVGKRLIKQGTVQLGDKERKMIENKVSRENKQKSLEIKAILTRKIKELLSIEQILKEEKTYLGPVLEESQNNLAERSGNPRIVKFKDSRNR